ncbi:MAG: hypothetical protein EAZ97_01975 [Bacteroidetes bacterium]|nr:MAG: hypothetical protein EAZ97_01975 [Bacteroidota bacterium]
MSNYDLFNPDSEARILKEYHSCFPLTIKFKNTFPNLTLLVEKAEVTEVSVHGLFRRVFVWQNQESEKIGWLLDQGTEIGNDENMNYQKIIPQISDFLAAHLLLIQNIGGIIEVLEDQEDEKLFTFGKNFLFSNKYCYQFSSQQVLEKYVGTGFDYNFKAEEMLCFVEEINGSKTFYNKQTGEVFLFGCGYDMESILELDKSQKYPVYTIKNAKIFVEYVEELAKQWLNLLKNN